MNTIDKRVRFAFEAVSELPKVEDQLTEILKLTIEQENRTRAMTAAFTASAGQINASLTTVRNAQQQTTGAVQQTTAAVQQAATQQVNALGLINKNVSTIGDSFSSLKNLVGLAFSVSEIKAFGESVIDAKSKTDVFRLGLTQMLQSQRDVSELYPKLLQLAQTTPFQVEELMQTTIRLRAMGVATNELIPTLINLGNAAAVIGTDKLPLVAKAYTDVMNKGKLMKQEINQFAENGIPIYDMLADSMGKTRSQVVAMAEDHTLSFKDIKKAFEDASKEGGRYYNMMNIQSQTLAGRISNLSDVFFVAKSVVGDYFENNIRTGITYTENLIKVLIGSESAVARTVNAIKTAVATWATYQVAMNLVRVNAALMTAAMIAKTAAVTAFNLAGAAFNTVILGRAGMTAAQTAAVASTRSLWAVFAANPIGALITLIGTVTAAYYAYKTATEEVVSSMGEQEGKLKATQSQLNLVAQSALNAGEGTEAHRQAVYRLIREYPEYFKGIDAEKVTNTQLKAILDRVNASFRERIALAREAYRAEQLAEKQKSLFQSEDELMNRVKENMPDLYAKSGGDIRSLMTEITKLSQADMSKLNKGGIFQIFETLTKGSVAEQIRALAQGFDSVEKEFEAHYTRLNKLSENEKKAMIAAENQRWLTVAANLKKGTKEYTKALDEHNNAIKQINGEAMEKDYGALVKHEKKKKDAVLFSAKELAVMTKQIQADTLKEQLALIDAQMQLDIDTINKSKMNRVVAAYEIKKVVQKAEDEKVQLVYDNRVKIEAIELQHKDKVVSMHNDTVKAKQRNEKELLEQIEKYRKEEQRIIAETAKMEKEARQDGVKMAFDYLAAQGGIFGDLARVAKRAFEDLDLVTGKTLSKLKANTEAAKVAMDTAKVFFGEMSEQYAQAKVNYQEAKKNEKEAEIATGKAKVGLIMMLAEVAEAIKGAIFNTIYEANRLVAESMLKVRDTMKRFYDDLIDGNKKSLDLQLKDFKGSFEERVKLMEEFYDRQREMAESRDALDATLTFNARVLEINNETTKSISDAWDISKGPFGPQTLLNVFNAWRNHNAQLKAVAYEREAYEVELRKNRIQEEIDAATQIYEATVDNIEKALEAFTEANEEKIQKAEDARDAIVEGLKDEIDASKDAYRKQVDAAKDAYSERVEALKDANSAADDLYRDQVEAVKDYYKQELDALKEKQSEEEKAIRDTYDLKQSLLEQSTSDEIEAIAILDRTRNEALERYRADEVARLTATRDRILATLTDEGERAQITADFARQIAEVHKEVEDAKLDKSKGVSLATKQLNAEQKDEAIRLKEEEKTALSVLDDAYQIKFKALADERDAKLEAMSEANKVREAEQKAELKRLEDAHDANLKKMADAQEARETELNDKIRKIEQDTANEIKKLKDEITAKDKESKAEMARVQNEYAQFMKNQNGQLFEAQRAMAVAELQVAKAQIAAKKGLFGYTKAQREAMNEIDAQIANILGTSNPYWAGNIQDSIPTNLTELAKTYATGQKLEDSNDKPDVYASGPNQQDGNGNEKPMGKVLAEDGKEYLYYEVNSINNQTMYRTKRAFFKGSTYLDLLGHYPAGQDTIPAFLGHEPILLDGGERVLPKFMNLAVGGAKTENEDLVSDYLAYQNLKKILPVESLTNYSQLARLIASDYAAAARQIERNGGASADSEQLRELKKLNKTISNGLFNVNVSPDRIDVDEYVKNRKNTYYTQI